MIAQAAFIHSQAVVDETSSVGDGSRVWQFASVIRGARVGARCIIGAGSQIDGAELGDDCHVQNHASIPHGVRIGNRVFVGPGAIFCNDMWPDWSRDGIDHQMIAAGTTIQVEEGASIGAGAIILPGVVIGALAVVAAGAVVERSVPSGMILRRGGYTGPAPKRGPRMRLIC